MAEIDPFNSVGAIDVQVNFNPFNKAGAVDSELPTETLYIQSQDKAVELQSGGLERLGNIISGAYDRGNAGKALNELYFRQLVGDDNITQDQINRLREKVSTEINTEGWFEDIVRAGAEQTPQLLGLAEQATERGLQGAMMGGVTAFIAGQAGPQIATPEEIITVPAASVTGGTIGVRFGVAEYSFTQNAGEAYGEFSEFLDKQGVKIENKNLARLGATMVGALNAGLDTISFGQLSKVFIGKNIIFDRLKATGAASIVIPKTKQAIFKWIADLGKAIAVESATEAGQEGIKGLGGNIVKNLSTQEFVNLTGAQILERMGEAAKEAAKATTAIGGVGGVIRAGVSAIPSGKQEEISDPQLAAKTIVEDEATTSDVKSAVEALQTKKPDFTIDELATTVQRAEIESQAMSVEKSSAESISVPYIETPEFKQRFEGSKVVDESGKPLRVYHGTSEAFDTFDISKSGEASEAKGASGAIFFSSSADEAGKYARYEGQNIRPAYLRLDDPLIIDHSKLGSQELLQGNGDKIRADAIKKAKKQGKDGVVFKNTIDFSSNRTDTYVAFSPGQIIPAFGEGQPPGKPPSDKRAFYQSFLDKRPKVETNILEQVGDAVGKALSPISTRLKNINPKFKALLRKYEQTVNLRINKDQEIVLPFLQKYSDLSKQDKVIVDAAMKNGDIDIIEEIMGDTSKVREALDGLYERAESVGLDIGYREGYFPRIVTKPKQLLAYFEKTEAWNDIQQAIKRKEMELGSFLTDDEKAQLINTLLRGYQTSQITLARPGALKERNIDTVTPEIVDFYAPSDQALLNYITSVNEAVEARKFFGKGENMADSIGAFVLRELEAGTLKPSQAQELSDILKARFTEKKMNPLLKAYKNFSYIDTMGSPISAITQIGDTSYAMANSGFFNTLSVLPKSITNRTELTLKDIGIEGIAQEFMDGGKTGNAVRWVFRKVQIERIDRIGKLTVIQSALNAHRKAARKPTKKYRQALEYIFGEETDQVLSDLRNKVNSDNVKLLLFNDLLDLQPVALSEMPELYLKHPNGRIFYMLKTFTIKQYDIYRNQVFQEIRAGNVKTGLRNLMRLVVFFTLMNAGGDFLKDLVLNRDTPLEDHVVNNIARLFGFGKYQLYSARKEGLGTATFKTIMPPFKAVDAASKDIDKIATKEDVDVDDLQIIGSIPIVGKMYYWWFGGGAEKEPKYKF